MREPKYFLFPRTIAKIEQNPDNKYFAAQETDLK